MPDPNPFNIPSSSYTINCLSCQTGGTACKLIQPLLILAAIHCVSATVYKIIVKRMQSDGLTDGTDIMTVKWLLTIVEILRTL